MNVRTAGSKPNEPFAIRLSVDLACRYAVKSAHGSRADVLFPARRLRRFEPVARIGNARRRKIHIQPLARAVGGRLRTTVKKHSGAVMPAASAPVSPMARLNPRSRDARRKSSAEVSISASKAPLSKPSADNAHPTGTPTDIPAPAKRAASTAASAIRKYSGSPGKASAICTARSSNADTDSSDGGRAAAPTDPSPATGNTASETPRSPRAPYRKRSPESHVAAERSGLPCALPKSTPSVTAGSLPDAKQSDIWLPGRSTDAGARDAAIIPSRAKKTAAASPKTRRAASSGEM